MLDDNELIIASLEAKTVPLVFYDGRGNRKEVGTASVDKDGNVVGEINDPAIQKMMFGQSSFAFGPSPMGIGEELSFAGSREHLFRNDLDFYSFGPVLYPPKELEGQYEVKHFENPPPPLINFTAPPATPAIEEFLRNARYGVAYTDVTEVDYGTRVIHESHEMVDRPVGGSECSKCWACLCHKMDILEAVCDEQPKWSNRNVAR